MRTIALNPRRFEGWLAGPARHLLRRAALSALPVILAACASAPPVPVAPPGPTWEQKLGAVLRLEDARVLRDPAPPPAPPPVAARGRRRAPAPPPLPPRFDLVSMLNDSEARVRRRAALAIGRTRLPDGVTALAGALKDPEPEVRQMAAFAIGLIGDRAGRDALLAVLGDADPRVQGRAAEALGLVGDTADAAPIAAMVQPYVASGVLGAIAPDELGFPLANEVEAVRLGLYALTRLGAWDALASVALVPGGQPVSRWWPLAYALQRVGDARAVPALLALVETPGRYTRAFAAKGLGAAKDPRAVDPLLRLVRDGEPAVAIEAVRALGQIGDGRAVAPLLALADDRQASDPLRVEAITALGQLKAADAVDLLLDLLSARWPTERAAAIRALALVDRDAFLTALSAMDADREWPVRAALASTLALLPADVALPRVEALVADADQRVVGPALAALAALKAPTAAAVLREHLRADDPVVRATAAAGLGELKPPDGAPALVEAFRLGQRDTTYTARAAALGALAKYGAEAATPTLRLALADRDWAVRVRAAQLLRGLVPAEDAAAAVRPAPNERPVDAGEEAALLAPPFSPTLYIDTDRGTIAIELAILDAPKTVANVMALARRGFFRDVAIHRVVPDFVVQDGDPRGDGEGGPGYTLRDEINQRPYLRGTVGMALDWEDTGGSQFFITLSPQPHLDARYTVFGQVVEGMEVVDRLQQWDVIRAVRVWDGVTMGGAVPQAAAPSRKP